MEFQVRLTCVQDVLDFVALATARPFPITVGDRHHRVDGKSFMEMFCLNLRRPLSVVMDCSEEEYECFREDAKKFLLK